MVAAALIFALLIHPNQMTDDPILQAGASGYNIVDLINITIAFAIIVAGALSIFYIFYGGISFILSGGQEDKIKQAVHTIRYAIIGLIITIFAVTIIAIIGSIFNFDLTAYIRWDKMSEIIRSILSRITNDSSSFEDSDSLSSLIKLLA